MSIRTLHPGRHTHAATEVEPEKLVRHGEADLGLTTALVGPPLTTKRLLETVFKTVVGRRHPLYKRGQAGSALHVDEVLKFPFVVTDRPVLGMKEKGQSTDGWRRDKFPRRIGFVASSLQMVEELVEGGHAIAYLPDYCAEQIPVVALKIVGCPYTCRQTVRLIAKSPEQTGCMASLFDRFKLGADDHP